jgi:hypothetical protein
MRQTLLGLSNFLSGSFSDKSHLNIMKQFQSENNIELIKEIEYCEIHNIFEKLTFMIFKEPFPLKPPNIK